MNIRDKEFDRLVLYAKGLGLKVTVYNKKSTIAASWDEKEIRIYALSNRSKTDLVLSLLHELGHNCNFVHSANRKDPKKLNKAWEKENSRLKGQIIGKSYRQLIYDDEAAGITYWDVIVKDTNIKIKKNRIELQKELDLWVYEVYLDTGEYPSIKSRNEKFKELRAKWK